MDSNTINVADNAVATMRALPWLSTPSASTRARVMTAWPAAPAPIQIQVCTASKAGEGSYLPAGALFSGMRTVIKTDLAVDLAWATCVDHKFSTRLGPSASPPV